MRSFSILVVALSLLPIIVIGQTSDASCLPYFAWANNSHKQSPCEVAAKLLAVCGAYTVASLPSTSHYSGPSLAAANPCICNTVVYSLMSACGACQSGTYETWSTWSGNCPTVAINVFPKPIPPQLFVPGWAYYDVKASDTFNETAVRLSANSTVESTALPILASTSQTASATLPPTSTKVATPSITSIAVPQATTSTSNSHRQDAVMGGIVGGVVGLAVLLGLTHWWYTRRRRLAIARSGVPLNSPSVESHTQQLGASDMQQYLANTVPAQLAASSINTSSLASPSSSQFPNLSKPGSVRSDVPSNV